MADELPMLWVEWTSLDGTDGAASWKTTDAGDGDIDTIIEFIRSLLGEPQ